MALLQSPPPRTTTPRGGESAPRPAASPAPAKAPQRQGAPSLGQLVLLLVPVGLAVWVAVGLVLVPPPVVPATAPASAFAAERALAYLPASAAEPHPVGSPAQARVRAYLLQQIEQLGLQPVTQDTTGAIASRTGVFASDLHNILVRLPGTASTGAVALMAHYDSQPNTAGASDDGSAVASLLETMRALRAGPPLRNDVLFVLTDAEEADAQGADAFFWQHPWARDVRLVVNFEAAGDTGTSLLLETSSGNRALVEAFAQAVPHPVVTSFLTQLNAVMPFGTDMTVFTENGVPGLSPMYGWHYRVLYHSLLDNVRALDPRSVQQQGESGLALARWFGERDLTQLDTTQDGVFFTLAPGVIVQYPASLAVPLATGVAVLLLLVLIQGVRRQVLRTWGTLAGIGLALVGVLVSIAVTAGVWLVISRLHPEYWRSLMGSPYGADLYFVGFVWLVVATSGVGFLAAHRWLTSTHLAAGGLVIWAALAVATSLGAPGTSYVFAWPAAVGTLALLGRLLWPATASGPRVLGGAAALGVAAGTVLLVVVPVILWTYLLVGFWLVTMQPSLPFIAAPMLLVALLPGVLILQLGLLTRRRPWPVPVASGLLALGFLVAGSAGSGFNAAQPMQNGVWYQLDADAGEAAWYSFGDGPTDAWTAQFFGGPIHPVDLTALYAATPGNPTPPGGFAGPAPVAALPSPEVTVLAEESNADGRVLRLHLASPRQARGLRVQVSGAPVVAASVDSVRLTNPAWATRADWFLRYYGLPAQGIDLTLDLAPPVGQLRLRVADQSDGLPALPGVTYVPRTPAMMPFEIAQEYMPYPETTSVSRTIALR